MKYRIITLVIAISFMNSVKAEEISALPEGYPSPVSNIAEIREKKTSKNISSCISGNRTLETVYAYENVQDIMAKKFNESSKCEAITKELEGINEVRRQIVDVTSAICSESAMSSSVVDPEQKRKILEDIYNKSSQEYSRFFAYDENLEHFEQCMTFYSNEATSVSITTEQQTEKTAVRTKRKVLEKHDLSAFYGENKGATGSDIPAMLRDIESKNVTTKEVKDYAVIEENRDRWELAGAMIGYLIYAFNESYIAIPFIKGVSYPCNKLPYTILKFEKKIEIPEKEYIVYLFEPLE